MVGSGNFTTSGMAPGGDDGVVFQQVIDEVTARKPRPPGDQRWTEHYASFRPGARRTGFDSRLGMLDRPA